MVARKPLPKETAPSHDAEMLAASEFLQRGMRRMMPAQQPRTAGADPGFAFKSGYGGFAQGGVSHINPK